MGIFRNVNDEYDIYEPAMDTVILAIDVHLSSTPLSKLKQIVYEKLSVPVEV